MLIGNFVSISERCKSGTDLPEKIFRITDEMDSENKAKRMI